MDTKKELICLHGETEKIKFFLEICNLSNARSCTFRYQNTDITIAGLLDEKSIRDGYNIILCAQDKSACEALCMSMQKSNTLKNCSIAFYCVDDPVNDPMSPFDFILNKKSMLIPIQMDFVKRVTNNSCWKTYGCFDAEGLTTIRLIFQKNISDTDKWKGILEVAKRPQGMTFMGFGARHPRLQAFYDVIQSENLEKMKDFEMNTTGEQNIAVVHSGNTLSPER